ncbi:hypothetical protein T02_10452 [Trichinella nativa]|uniref:Uncharacterized protein n=1 Tax=Trichinella nativa TaxID=6335 RepID=A0A0V1LSY6_9BILA|nr:hypothetical protein T02_10452 [Trichinella nativa]
MICERGIQIWMEIFNYWSYPAFVLISQPIQQQFLLDLPAFGITFGLVIRCSGRRIMQSEQKKLYLWNLFKLINLFCCYSKKASLQFFNRLLRTSIARRGEVNRKN